MGLLKNPCQRIVCLYDDAKTRPTRDVGENLPPSGTFALHGRPVDVLSHGRVLLYVRARYYDPQHRSNPNGAIVRRPYRHPFRRFCTRTGLHLPSRNIQPRHQLDGWA